MILGYTPKITMCSKEAIDNFSAVAYSKVKNEAKEDELWFSERVFDRALIWHECGHLLTPWTPAWSVKSETEAQVMAILVALNKGFIQVARELIEELDVEWLTWGDDHRIYKLAIKEIKERLPKVC